MGGRRVCVSTQAQVHSAGVYHAALQPLPPQHSVPPHQTRGSQGRAPAPPASPKGPARSACRCVCRCCPTGSPSAGRQHAALGCRRRGPPPPLARRPVRWPGGPCRRSTRLLRRQSTGCQNWRRRGQSARLQLTEVSRKVCEAVCQTDGHSAASGRRCFSRLSFRWRMSSENSLALAREHADSKNSAVGSAKKRVRRWARGMSRERKARNGARS